LLRWRDSASGEEYEAWSNIDFNHLTALDKIETADRKWIFLLRIENVDTSLINPRTGQGAAVPSHPVLPTDGPGFEVTKGNGANQNAIASLEVLHTLYRTKGTELSASAAERRRIQQEQEVLEKANPPQPEDNVMWFRPRKGSRYLQAEGGAR